MKSRLQPFLEPVVFRLAAVLYESDDKMEYAYFPTTAIISLLHVMENGATAEIGVIGNDGVVGVALFMGGDSTSSCAQKSKFLFSVDSVISEKRRFITEAQRLTTGR